MLQMRAITLDVTRRHVGDDDDGDDDADDVATPTSTDFYALWLARHHSDTHIERLNVPVRQ